MATGAASLAAHLAASLAALAQSAPPVVPSDVETTVRRRVDYGYCPGVVVGLMDTNGTTYFCYGQTSLDAGLPVDEHTLFEIGSITKVFTTTILADMAERGELALTNPIQPYLPVGVTAPERQGRAITLTHLATHTSGLPSAPSNITPLDNRNPFAGYTDELMYGFLSSYSLTRNPGATYEYSNYGMGLLGQLLARLAGMGFEELVAQRVTRELGLDDTRVTLTASQRGRLARGYSGVAPIPEFDMTALNAAGALRSTAKDLLKFLAANRGWQPTPLFVAMTNAHRSRVSTSTAGMTVGLGWHLYSLSTGTAIWHNGATIGHRAFAGFLRGGNTLVVALANSDFDVTDIGFHLLDTRSPLVSLRVPVSLPLSALKRYVGRYEHSEAGQMTIGLLRDHLTLEHSLSPGRYFTLHPSGVNRFYLVFPDAQGTFNTNATGAATALAWTQSGVTTTFAKAPQRSTLGLAREGGSVSLHLSGDTDRLYVIEASSDLRSWTAISTNTIWENPILDPGARGLDRRFYRVFEP